MSRKKKRSKRHVPPSVEARIQRKQAEAEAISTRRRWLIGGAVAVLIIAAVVLWFTVGPGKPVPPTPTPTLGPPPTLIPTSTPRYSAPPEMQIDPEKAYFATISTNKGDILAMLFADKAPKTVNNFVVLSRDGYYDGIIFHRVIADFMAQAGDPTGTGSGGPGYQFADEFHPDLKHDRPGVLSMANSGANTNGSQFFITHVPTPWLDAYDENGDLKNCADPQISCHAVFGQVLEGMDVVLSVEVGDVIETITITEE
jgi:cyclophilin family peptidyl-prolyl cis-trans isomerase